MTQLFLSLQSRPDLNFSDFFKFENHFEPPALASKGMVRTGTKSDILECLGDPKSACKEAKKTTIHILGMPAVIHMVRPTYTTTFMDYVTNNLIQFFKSQISDKLNPNGDTPIPKRDWQRYLKNAENKSELFSFCNQILVETQVDNIQIVTTLKVDVISNKAFDTSLLSPYNHHEADTHIILHLAHTSKDGHKEAYVRTVNSDIVVLAIAFFDKLNFSKLWIGFGCGKYYRDIPIHELYAALGPERSHAHPFFHALSGCDTTSHILGYGKKTVWGAWQIMPEITETLLRLNENLSLFSLDSAEMKNLKSFFVIMHKKSAVPQQLMKHGINFSLLAHGILRHYHLLKRHYLNI